MAVDHFHIPPSSVVADIPCELKKVGLAGGYPAVVRFFRPRRSCRAVLYLHGIQSHGGWFLRSVDYLRRHDIAVLLPDRRGSGLNRKQRGHCESPRQLTADVDCWVEWLRRETGFRKIDIVAVSWSAKLALAYARQYAEKISSIVLVTPGLCVKIDVSFKEKINIGVHGLTYPFKQHEIPLNYPEMFTANPPMLRFLENDPLKLTRATAAFFITSLRLDLTVRKVVDDLPLPVYLFLAEKDRITDNQATIALLNKILTPLPGSDEPAKIYPAAHHTLDFEPDPLPFFKDLAGLFPATSG